MSQQRRSRYDRFFGGDAGAAGRALEAMKKTYGPKGGPTMFEAIVVKKQRREKRGRR